MQSVANIVSVGSPVQEKKVPLVKTSLVENPLVDFLPQERQRLILDQLGQDGRVVAIELARQFRTSEDTIRRDLRELAAAGLCERVYGGALPTSQMPVSPALAPLTARLDEAADNKRALGEALVSLLPAGQVVFVDAGSTNLAAMRALPVDHALIVITNSPLIAAELASREAVQLILVGGQFDRRVGAAFGTRALHDVADFRPDVYLLGVCAVDAREGIAVFGFDEAEFKRSLIARSRRLVAAATTDKLGTSAPFVIAQAQALTDLVLEADVPETEAQALQQCGICIHRAAATVRAITLQP